jgi:beta-glucosidase
MGGGSAQLNPYYTISPWEALVARMGEDHLIFAQGCTNHRWEPLWTGKIVVEFFASKDLSGAPVHSETMHAAEAFWIPPFAGGKVDTGEFSARMTGVFTPALSGAHRFGLLSAGFSRLYVDGRLVTDAWDGWTKGRTFFEEGCDEVVGETELEADRPVEVVIEFGSKRFDNLQFSAFRAGIGRPLGNDDIKAAARAAAEAETAIVFVGRSGEWDTEGSDLEDIALPGRQDELVEAVIAVNPRTVVVLQTGGPVEMPWAAKVPAILQAWYPGQEAGNAISDVLFGDVEPGGRLPQTFPVRWSDNPTWSQDPAIYPGKDGKVRYEEGVFVGYRHYDRYGVEPMFPFGHGLSYAVFDLADLWVERSGGRARAEVALENRGHRRGSTVVQVYVGDHEASVARPQRELKAFRKITLDPGERQRVIFDLPPRAFAYFDRSARLWRIEDGLFEISVGFSAGDIRLTTSVEIAGATLAI